MHGRVSDEIQGRLWPTRDAPGHARDKTRGVASDRTARSAFATYVTNPIDVTFLVFLSRAYICATHFDDHTRPFCLRLERMMCTPLKYRVQRATSTVTIVVL